MSQIMRVFLGIGLLAAALAAQQPERQNPIWQEFGLQQVLQTKVGDTPVTAFQLKDTTGAMGALQWLRSQEPPDQLTQVGNYIVRWPAAPTLAAVGQAERSLPKVDHTALPALPSYLPKRGLLDRSRRYSLGEASLRAFEPRLPAEAVGFQSGAEVQLAQVQVAGGTPATLALVLYPTPQFARLHAAAMEKIPGATVRRNSSLVSVVLGADERAANKVLDQVRYQPIVVWNEGVPKPEKNFGVSLLEMIALAGVLIAASVVMGFLFGGIRLFRGKRYGDPNQMIVLHLSDK